MRGGGGGGRGGRGGRGGGGGGGRVSVGIFLRVLVFRLEGTEISLGR